jgi:uncharacterized damage-inducible protein DinB
MIDPGYVQTFAAYGKWQNASLFDAASSLSDAQRRADRGAFFKSVHATLNHLLWADAMWMSRFSELPRPETPFPGVDHIADWDELAVARAELDEKIVVWAAALTASDLAGDLVWQSSIAGRVSRPRWIAVAHMFNHQTHHRGQVHALLTGLGAKPQDTDLVLTHQYLPQPA